MSAESFNLTPVQLDQYDRDGYLVIPNFFSRDKAKELFDRAQTLLNEFELPEHLTAFGTDVDEHVGDAYFLESGDKIRYFFEPSSVSSTGALNRKKAVAVNKIGHALHELDPVFRAFTLENEKIKSIARALPFVDPRVIQSMLIFKQPEIGAPVLTHCDSTFLYTSPPSACGLWFAMEKCTTTNGCLSFLPGSHKVNSIAERLVRVPGGGTKIVAREGSDAVVEGKTRDWDAEQGWKIEECEIGDVVLIHGSVIHRSEANKSDRSRFIYTFHMIEGKAEWDELNWLQPSQGKEFTKLML